MSKEFLGLLAATAVLIVPTGFLMGALSVAVLRLVAWLLRWPTYEAQLNEEALDRLWKQVRPDEETDKKLILYAAATFDHEIVPDGIHKWIMRRWKAFNVAISSGIALVLAHGLAVPFQIPQSLWWTSSTLAAIVILLLNAILAWRETMAMMDFQSHRKPLPPTHKSSV